MQKKRNEWRLSASSLPIERVKFLDESGFNIDLVRRYGRSIGENRVVGSAPLNTPPTTTVVSSIDIEGNLSFMSYSGGTTNIRFQEYLKEVLIPSLKPGDYVVMDNLNAHHAKGVDALLRSAGAVPLYLPPYSPDFNPIEKMWSKVKGILRGNRARCLSQLKEALDNALAQITPENCLGWFRCAGYSC